MHALYTMVRQATSASIEDHLQLRQEQSTSMLVKLREKFID